MEDTHQISPQQDVKKSWGRTGLILLRRAAAILPALHIGGDCGGFVMKGFLALNGVILDKASNSFRTYPGASVSNGDLLFGFALATFCALAIGVPTYIGLRYWLDTWFPLSGAKEPVRQNASPLPASSGSHSPLPQ